MSKSYKDGQCYPNGQMGMSEHPKGLAKIGLTQAERIEGSYKHGGEHKLSHSAMMPKGVLPKASKHHSHKSKS